MSNLILKVQHLFELVKQSRPEPETFTILCDRRTVAIFNSLYAKMMWRKWNHLRRYRAYLRRLERTK